MENTQSGKIANGQENLGAIIRDAVDFLCSALENIRGAGKGATKVIVVDEAKIALAISNAIAKRYFRLGEGKLFVYTGRKFVALADDSVKRMISEIMDRMEIGEVYRVNSVNKVFASIFNNHLIKPFEPKNTILSFRNKVLDLATLKQYCHSEDLQTRIFLDFDYDAIAQAPRWESFLTEVIGDPASIKVLQEFMGLIFVDRSVLNVEAAMFLYGTGGNGKSVVYDMMRYVLGNDNCSSYDLSQLCTHSQADYYVASCNGKLLNFASDMGDKDFSGGRYNAIVSHEAIVCRQPGGQSFEARDMPLLVANINKKPVVTDSSDGFWRRNQMIEFDRTFSENEQDKLLKSKLRAEVSGVLNWILEGRLRIMAQGGLFTSSKKMAETREKNRIDSNSVLQFLDFMGYTAKPKPWQEKKIKSMHTSELILEYKDYCNNNSNQAKNKTNFCNDLKMAGFQYVKCLRCTDKRNFVSTVSTGYMFYVVTGSNNEEEETEARRAEEELAKVIVKELPF